MTSRRAPWGVALALAAGVAAAQTPGVDEQRAAWRYRRAIETPAGSPPGFVALPLPPELAVRAARDLRDLRLVTAQGVEVPHLLDRPVGQRQASSAVGLLVDARRLAGGPVGDQASTTVWTVDLGGARRFDTLSLELRDESFAKRLKVEGSADRQVWRLLREDAGVFDADWTPRVRHTSIELDAPATARYLRLTTGDDRRSPPVELVAVTASLTKPVSEGWRREVTLAALAGAPGRYRLDLAPGFPVERLYLEADDASFARHVRLLELVPGQAERPLAAGLLYRIRLRDSPVSGAALSLALERPPGRGSLILDLGGDAGPLQRPRLEVGGVHTRLLFEHGEWPVALYYGNELTRAPGYLLEPLRERLAAEEALAVAALGPEVENPRYRRPAPLPFAAVRGAPLDVRGWASLRRVRVAGPEDLWGVTLDPLDVSALRPDLGDLRVVDAEADQVPYVLEHDAAEVPLDLAVDTLAPAAKSSRYRLQPVASLPGTEAVPLHALELEIATPFFDRPARVFAATGRSERPLRWWRLVRPADPGVGARAPVRVTLDGRRVSGLVLEVDDGDDAPLSLGAARATVRVPRIVFKARPGEYRLLLGNRDAEAPRYDLASLRQEVLSYSARPATVGPLEPNPARRRSPGEYLGRAPSTLLLWGTLLVAVAVLLWLTVRALRQPGA